VNDDYRRMKPGLCALLDLLRIGVDYERALGDRLWFRDDNGREREVIDFVGGYGSLLLGHNHPALVAEAQAILSSGRPMHAQGSRRVLAGRLSSELSRRAGGDYRVVLANSGAEAVEAAMKHAMLETGARTFVALEGGFHGKTLGALQLTAGADYRDALDLPCLAVRRVRPNDVARLEQAFDGDIAGFVFEPIQGEGGVREIDPAFARRAADLCAARGVPLIADEIQSGMGRTGTFLACEALGVSPDYVCLSKTLGGGLAKIAALLVRAGRWVDRFDFKHSSTYAEDDYSCAIALKALDLIDDAALALCRTKGARLLAALRDLQAEHPGVIADVRGRGLMIGVELRPRRTSFILRMLSSQGDLALAVAAYLFHAHGIRVAPTMSDRWTLRLEPSCGIADADVDRLVLALREACARLSAGDALGLTSHLAADDGFAAAAEARDGLFVHHERPAPAPLPAVGWLCHMIDADALICFDGAFARMTHAQREAYLRRTSPRGQPILINSVDIRSATGASARLHVIGLFYTSRLIKELLDARDLDGIQAVVRGAVDRARELGCGVVALGQYTSMVTLNGTLLREARVGITTGNSYPLALALQAVDRAQSERGVDPAASTLAIVGASGNIGRALAEVAAPRYRHAILVGSARPGARLRLQEFARTIPNARVSTSVREADVVIAAVNAVDAPLGPDAFAAGAIVCDLSVPACVRSDTWDARPDLLLFKGGLAQLPGGEELGITSFPLPAGQTFGCMAEGLLLGFEGVRDSSFTGTIRAEHIRRIEAMAARHGFALADYKRSCPLGSGRREDHVLSP